MSTSNGTTPEFTSVKDSGARQEFSTGSVRDTQKGKGRFDLIPTHPMRRLARHYENGAAKYGDRNWEKGQPLMRYLDSLERHLNLIKSGDLSEDHAAAVAWNAFGYMHTLRMIEAGKLPKELDNRPPPDPDFEVAASNLTGTPNNPLAIPPLVAPVAING